MSFVDRFLQFVKGTPKPIPQRPGQDGADHLLDLDKANAREMNEATRVPAGDRISYRAITLSELYVGSYATNFPKELRKFTRREHPRSLSAELAKFLTEDRHAIGSFRVWPNNPDVSFSPDAYVSELPDFVSSVYFTYYVIGPSLIGVCTTFEIAAERIALFESPLNADAEPSISWDESGSYKLLNVQDVKRDAITSLRDSLTSECSNWLSTTLPGAFGVSQERHFPTVHTLTFALADVTVAIPPFMRTLGWLPSIAVEQIDAVPLLTIRTPFFESIALDQYVPISESRAVSDGWIAAADDIPLLLHRMISTRSLLYAIAAEFDLLNSRIRQIRAAYNTFDFGTIDLKSMLALRTDLLEVSRDIASIESDLIPSARRTSLIWTDYFPLTSLQIDSRIQPRPSPTLDDWLGSFTSNLEVTRKVESLLTADLREFSSATTDLTNFNLGRSLNKYTLCLIGLTVAIAVFAFISLRESHDVTRIDYLSHAPTRGGSSGGYGLVVGDVGPCTAKQFDASPQTPLIVVLTKNGRTIDWYNVSTDQGTTSFHFDVPVGRYKLITTWPGSSVLGVLVKFEKTTRVNFSVACGPYIAP